MNSNKKTARMAGLLFLTAMATFLLGDGLIQSVVNAPDYLKNVYPNKTQMIVGVLFEFMNDAAVVGIAVVLFPILKKYNEKIALGYVAFRVVEAAILIVGAIFPLLLIILSQEYIQAGDPDALYFQTLGAIAIKGMNLAYQVAMIFLGLGSLMFCYLLYQSRLIPRWIAVIGLIGYPALLASSCLGIFGFDDIEMILYIPGALFEIIFPIWLIVKGFNLTALDSGL